MPKTKPPTDDVNYAEIAALRLTQVQALTDELDRLEDQHALDRVLLTRERDSVLHDYNALRSEYRQALQNLDEMGPQYKNRPLPEIVNDLCSTIRELSQKRRDLQARANAAEANLSNALAAFRNMSER